MRLLTAVLMLGFVGFAASAQDRKGAKSPGTTDQPQQSADHGPRFDVDRFFKDHDKNNDGKLSKDEVPDCPQEEFSQTDANHDGSVSKDELRQHAAKMARQRPQAVEILYYVIDFPEETVTVQELQQAYDMLRKLDKDHNGKIDASDLKAFRQQRREERINATFKHLDKNNDGKISKDEARGVWSDDFAQLDKNHDGALDHTEVQAAFDTHHATAGDHGTQPLGSQPPPRKKGGQEKK